MIPIVDDAVGVAPNRQPRRRLLADRGTSRSSRTVISNTTPSSLRSFEYGAISTVIALVVCYPMAYWIAFHGGRHKTTYLLLILLPFFVSFVIRTLAWQFILSDNGIVLGTLKSWHLAAAELPRPRHADRRDRGHHLQLPPVHGAAALRRAREDRPPRGPRRRTTSTRAAARSSREVDPAAVGRRASSRASCSSFVTNVGDYVNAAILGGRAPR